MDKNNFFENFHLVLIYLITPLEFGPFNMHMAVLKKGIESTTAGFSRTIADGL